MSIQISHNVERQATLKVGMTIK